MLKPTWYLIIGEGFFLDDLPTAPRLDDDEDTKVLDAAGEILYLLGDDGPKEPAVTVLATHLAIASVEHLHDTVDFASRSHNVPEALRLISGLNLLTAYLTQTIQKLATHTNDRTYPGLGTAPAAVVTAVTEALSRAGSSCELVAGHLKEAHLALRPLAEKSEKDSQ